MPILLRNCTAAETGRLRHMPPRTDCRVMPVSLYREIPDMDKLEPTLHG